MPRIYWGLSLRFNNVWYFNNNIDLLIYLRRRVLVIWEIIDSRDFWWYFYENLKWVFVDGLNCMYFLLDISLWTFNQNARICSYERLEGSNYDPLSESRFVTETVFTLFYRQLRANLSCRSCLCHYESQSWKLLNSCIAIVW